MRTSHFILHSRKMLLLRNAALFSYISEFICNSQTTIHVYAWPSNKFSLLRDKKIKIMSTVCNFLIHILLLLEILFCGIFGTSLRLMSRIQDMLTITIM